MENGNYWKKREPEFRIERERQERVRKSLIRGNKIIRLRKDDTKK